MSIKVTTYNGHMLDIANPEHEVEVCIRHDGEVIWVNVDGLCRLRICNIKGKLVLNDDRPD